MSDHARHRGHDYAHHHGRGRFRRIGLCLFCNNNCRLGCRKH